MAAKNKSADKEQIAAAKAEAKEARKQAAAARAQATRAKAEAATAKLKGGAGRYGSGFMNFVREQGVVGLAVGLAIGLEAGALTKQIVASFITPTIDLLAGPGGLASLEWTVALGDRSATYVLGDLIIAVVRFLAVALVIYIVVHGLKLDRLDKKKV